MLQASDLTKAHDGAPLFDGLSFVLGDGERAGLVGPNGVGKSTLLRLLAGRRSPRSRRGRAPARASASAGCRRRRRTRARPSASCSAPGWARCGPCAASCSALLARLAEGDTSPATLERYGHAQERFEALGGWALEASLDEARRALGIDHLDAGTPLARLSGGEQARALLAGTLLAAPTVLLLDEPTNHLDGDGLRWLEEWLRGFPGTVVVVSHDRAFLDAVVGCILELEPGGALTRYEGGYSDSSRRARAPAGEARARRTRRRRSDDDAWRRTSRRRAARRSTPSARSAAPRRPSSSATPRRWPRRPRRARAGCGASSRATRAVARARRAPGAASAPARPRARAPAHRGAARRALAAGCADVELTLHRGDRVAVTGPNGAGKTTLLDVLSGVLVPAAGTVELAGAVRVLPQTPVAAARASERVVDWLRAQASLDEGAARTLLGAFALDTAAVAPPAGAAEPGRARAGAHGGDGRLGRGAAAPRRADQPPRPRDARGGRGRAARLRRARSSRSPTTAPSSRGSA